MNSIWKEYKLTKDTDIQIKLGDVKIICKQKSDELLLNYSYKNSLKDKNDEWQRWTLKNKGNVIRILPVFPDRPVVVKPENKFNIIKNSEVKIYVRVPLWIKIELLGSKNHTLIEIPTVILSNTWFGNFFDGELCYWISSGAKRNFSIDLNKSYSAICPIKLINKADEDLSVEKISLRVINLDLYLDQDQIWSEETKVLYTGSLQESEIEVSGKTPSEAPKSKLIMHARKEHKSTFTAKTFSSLKELPGLGIFMK